MEPIYKLKGTTTTTATAFDFQCETFSEPIVLILCFYLLSPLQIGELKPATSYIFLVRAENSHGLSIPSSVSSVVKTLGAENGVIPQSELSAARNVLSGKVSLLRLSPFNTNILRNERKYRRNFPTFPFNTLNISITTKIIMSSIRNIIRWLTIRKTKCISICMVNGME